MSHGVAECREGVALCRRDVAGVSRGVARCRAGVVSVAELSLGVDLTFLSNIIGRVGGSSLEGQCITT